MEEFLEDYLMQDSTEVDQIQSIIEEVYSSVNLTSFKIKEKNLEKKLIPYIYQISYDFDGILDYSIPGVVFLKFPSKGLKPVNQYNFYFESGLFRCNNQLNFHQKSSSFEMIGEMIDEDMIVADIFQFIKTIPMEKSFKDYTPVDWKEFSNPF